MYVISNEDLLNVAGGSQFIDAEAGCTYNESWSDNGGGFSGASDGTSGGSGGVAAGVSNGAQGAALAVAAAFATAATSVLTGTAALAAVGLGSVAFISNPYNSAQSSTSTGGDLGSTTYDQLGNVIH